MSDDAMRIVELCDELEKARRYYLELDDYRKVMQAEIERLRKALAKERERCAQVAESFFNENASPDNIAAAIRALKDEP
jgi:hypothetical protein